VFTFRLVTVNKLGTFDSTYGQRFWAIAEGSDLPVSFNSKERDIPDGATIDAVEKSIRRSQKGTEYIGLKRVTIADQKPLTTPQNASESVIDEKLTLILERLDFLIERLSVADKVYDPDLEDTTPLM
jgi:hypothetical protein